MILGIVAVTLIVVAIAAPKPKVVYEASAYVSPTTQVMQGGVTTANKDATSSTAPNRDVILSNLIILAQQSEVYDRARIFLAKTAQEQKQQMMDLSGPDVSETGVPDGKTLSTVTLKDGHLLTGQDWNDVLEVAPVQNTTVGEKGTTTDIIRLTIRMPNGTDAPFLANAVAVAFAQAYQEKSRADIRTYEKFLQTSRDEAKSKLGDLSYQIAQYKQEHKVVSVEAEAQSAATTLANYESAKATADSAVREAEAALNDINSQLATQPLVTKPLLPAEMNPNVKKLQDELAQAESDLRVIAQRYKPAHETYKAAQARIAVIKSEIAKEGKTYSPPAINDVHQDLVKKRSEAMYTLATARARSAALAVNLAQAQAKIKNLTQAEPTLTSLMTEYARADNTYKTLSDKYDQAIIAEKEFTRTGSIVPYGWATNAQGPIVQGPSRKHLLLYGFVLSLVLGVVIAVWLDSIDNRMRNAADVEKLLELPVVGLTPQLTGRDGTLPKLTHLYPLSAMAESYRILRTNILFALREKPFKTLMVATGRPGQGGTTTICNLAIALAQIGKRIILIDADMRRPSLHKFFGVPNEAGLSTLLQGKGTLTDAFQKTDIENLIVLPAGPQPLNPSELLGSENMHDLVGRLEEYCDLVLFDSPSTVVFSDGPMLASWIDAVLMVVSANQVPRGTEAQTRDLLRRAKANILGVVVNRMAPDNVDSCYFYSHYYADSAPKLDTAEALASGNGKKDGVKPPDTTGAKPKAIPAPVIGSAKADEPDVVEPDANVEEEDNPFPD